MPQNIDLLLVNEEPLFQLGLRGALAAYSDLQVVAEADPSNALERLAQLEGENPLVAIAEGTIQPNSFLLQQCEQIKRTSPNTRILLLCPPLDSQQLLRVREAGVDGYCSKNSSIQEIVEATRQVAAGRGYWSNAIASSASAIAEGRASPFQEWLYASCQDGLAQIDANLSAIASALEDRALSTWDWLFWTGRRRELRVARFLVDRLSPRIVIVVPELPRYRGEETASDRGSSLEGQPERASASLVPTGNAELPAPYSLFNRALAQIQLGVENRSGKTLEIDILQREKKQELLYLVLRRMQEMLEQWRFLQIPAETLAERRSQFLQQVWQNCILEFMGKYCTPPAVASLTAIALQESPFIQATTLDRIPFVVDLLAYLLYEAPLIIDSVPYSSNTPEALNRAQLLLDNLAIQLANSIMQLLLNSFPEENSLKYNLYDRRYWSSREIARLRNELSWKYRQDYYFEEPKAIFESRYRLLAFEGSTIKRVAIFAPRLGELERLQGLRWLVSIVLETRDAIAPRLRAAFRFLGRGVVYLLTQVLGKGLGLIGRGIIQGFGNALQDSRYGKNSQQGK